MELDFFLFTGAIGCSLLAYILPCLIHLKIKGRAMRLRLIIKDLLIIFLAVIASILTMVVIIGEIAAGKLKWAMCQFCTGNLEIEMESLVQFFYDLHLEFIVNLQFYVHV